MTIKEFAARLDDLDQLLITVLHMFEEDTGVKVNAVTVHTNEDNAYEVRIGLDFPESEKAE